LPALYVAWFRVEEPAEVLHIKALDQKPLGAAR
jgi:hypothetical protein